MSRIFPGRVCLPDIITLRGRNRFPGLSKSALPQQNYLPGIESPSRYRIALRIDRESLFFVGFARIGRVFLSMEGGMVACVLNREAGTVGNGWLGWGFGGWNCSGRVFLSGEGVVATHFSWLCLSA